MDGLMGKDGNLIVWILAQENIGPEVYDTIDRRKTSACLPQTGMVSS